MKSSHPVLSNPETLQESAARGLEAISILVGERDTIRARNEKLEVDVAMLGQEVAQLRSRLETTTSERDLYMRHSTELVARLNNIQILINDAVREAGTAAYRRPPVMPPPNKLDAEDASPDTLNIRNLISRLPRNTEGTNNE